MKFDLLAQTVFLWPFFSNAQDVTFFRYYPKKFLAINKEEHIKTYNCNSILFIKLVKTTTFSSHHNLTA